MTQPNILLITTDQHNAEILGCAGNPVVRTPNIDRLAAGGMVFDAAFTSCPICTPARTSIFTGQYGQRHGVTYNINIRQDRPAPPHHTGLAADATAFPKVLAAHHYHTSLIGKLHAKQAGVKNFGLRLMKLAEGKGQFVGFGAPPDDYRRYLKARGHPGDVWRTWELPAYAREGFVTCPIPEEDYIDAWTASVATEHLQRVEPPFFSWVSFSSPHTPWDPPRPYDMMYSPSEVPFPARRRGELEEKHPDWVDRLAKTKPACPTGSQNPDAEGGIERAYGRFSDDQVRGMLAAYYGLTSLIDAQVGSLLSVLEGRGLRESTLIVFTADHGDYLGNNWAFYKYDALYDSLVRVPFIVNWPGHVAAGNRRRELVSLIDLAPTFLEAAGARPVDPVDGRSLRPLLKGEPTDWRRELLLEGGRVHGILTPGWKYIRWRDGFEELYDRRLDPHDLQNLARRPDKEPLCRMLAARLANLMKRS